MRGKVLWGIMGLLLVGGEAVAGPSEVVLQTIALESASESMEGQVAVAGVILERARRSGKSLEAVCLARKQFSCWNDPKWAKRWLGLYYTPKARQNSSNALKMAYQMGSKEGFTHYHVYQVNQYGEEVRPYWARGKKGVRIDSHVFYRGIK